VLKAMLGAVRFDWVWDEVVVEVLVGFHDGPQDPEYSGKQVMDR